MQPKTTKEAKATAKHLLSSVPWRSSRRAPRRRSRPDQSASESAVSLGMSLMGRPAFSVPVLSNAPASFTLSKDKTLSIELLRSLTEAGILRYLVPTELPTGPEELLIGCFNRWLGRRSRNIDGWVEIDASLSLKDDYAVFRLSPMACGYFAAFDQYYATLHARSGELGHAFYSLIYLSLNRLGYIYDLDAAQMLKERINEMHEEELVYAASGKDQDAATVSDPESDSYLKFDKIPESFLSPLPFDEALKTVTAENQIRPSPVLRVLMRLARASRETGSRRTVWHWHNDSLKDESFTYEDEGSDLPLILLPFAQHSVIEQAFDEESQYFGEMETCPLIRISYKRGMKVKHLVAELKELRHWLHTLTLAAALSKQIERVQAP